MTNPSESAFDYGRAYAEACRCLLCHDAPCSQACPAGTDPAAFLRKFRMRNVKGAIRTIKENNILGCACGALCPTARLCEKACCASGIDKPVRIGAIQSFLVQHGWQLGFQPLQPVKPSGGHVAVVGSGPAGLACAAALALAGCRVTVFESRPKPGGVLAWGVPTWRFPADLLDKELEDIRRLGVELKCSQPVRGPGEAEALLGKGFDAVFLGPGCWEPSRLGGERAPGVLAWPALLTAIREGREQELATEIQGKTVAVLGGGSVAMDCVQVCHHLGASEVYIVYRRSYLQMPAEHDELQEALNAGTHFLLLNQPTGYVRDDGGRVKGVKLLRTRLGEPDKSGRRQPVEIGGSDWVLDADCVVEALGSAPDPDSPKWYPSVQVDRGKLVRIDDKTGATSKPGIFAGGDVVAGPALIVTAVRDGKTAARGILQYLGGVR
jgi:glutamate synthase (NADPH) small chain